MLSRISLYSSPSARIRINGTLSPAFHIHNGMWQGCPLSPLLYVLTMEHLAEALRNNPNIRGISPVHTKLALFADDLLMFVTQPHLPLPSIIQEFRLMSNFMVNHSKSEILNFSVGGGFKTTFVLILFQDWLPFYMIYGNKYPNGRIPVLLCKLHPPPSIVILRAL